ncbi:MAG: hypothetical protein ACKO7G_06820 [Gammaproteobacteria bacterium]
MPGVSGGQACRSASRLASARALLGAGLVLAGALVLTGLDKRLEAWILDAAPDWLVRLSTSL